MRTHRDIARRTPASVYGVREKATPTGAVVETDGRRLRLDKGDKKGTVTIRYRCRLHHIGPSTAYRGLRIAMLVDDRDIEIVSLDGSPAAPAGPRPDKDYQPQP